jgi:hypothetical protein
MNYKLSRRDARLSAVLYSPIDRIESGPLWAKMFAAGAGVYQYVRADAFLSALLLVIVVGVVDYVLGTKASTSKGIPWDRKLATRGAYGKISGWLLLGLVRLVEHWLYLHALIPHSRGVFATVIAISLVAIDLQSIADHRETFGATPIPVLSAVLVWLQRFASSLFASRVPPDPADTPARRVEDSKP